METARSQGRTAPARSGGATLADDLDDEIPF
jgi:hypothetical protein